MPSLDAFFESVQLPTMNEVAHALIRTLNDENAKVEAVSKIISDDPALTAKILRLANSAQFGLPRGVATIDEAIQMVGLSKVRTLSLGACLNNAFPLVPGLDRREFWATSTACAGYAQWLATPLGIDGQMAWLTGLMLRLGELLIAQANPAVLQEIERLPHIPGGRWEREIRLVGFAESQITAELARRWNFPMQMVQALHRAADPLTEQAFSRLGAILHLAGIIADTPQPDARVIDTLPVEVIDSLQLDIDRLRDTFPAADSFVDVAAA